MSSLSRVHLEQGFLLHRRAYRETSLLLDFLTQAHGRVTVLGKGARRNKRFAQALMFPFSRVSLSWSGRGELPLLTSVEVIDAAPLTDPRVLACALYLNELCMRLLAPHDPHPDVFDQYAVALGELPTRPEQALRTFELGFLQALGYGFSLEIDAVSGEPVRRDGFYRYMAQQGIVKSNNSAEAVPGSALMGLSSGVFESREDLRAAKRLMRTVIGGLLNGRGLKSRELLTGMPT